MTCTYHTIPVQCGPGGLKWSPDALYRKNGDGTFTDVVRQSGVGDAQKFSRLSAQWTDLIDDGRLALLVAYDGEQNYLYPNNGTFTDLAYQAGVAVNQDGNEQADMGVAMGDYQHIGRLDIAITHFSEDYAELYRNDGSVNFTDVPYDSCVAPTTEPFVG